MPKKDGKAEKEHVPYRDGLNTVEKARYLDKLKIIGGDDPYEMKNMSDSIENLPSVTNMDIVVYLLHTPSPYTMEEIKCYKSTDAFNYFVSGWVREKKTSMFGDNVVVTAKVLHSQRLREKPLRPWVIASKTGNIKAAHCDCMAGLGEACSHIAALLFSIEATVKLRESVTVTQKPAYWMLPSDVKNISYSEIRHIDFSSAKNAKKRLDQQIDGQAKTNEEKVPSKSKVLPPSENELSSFFGDLHVTGTKPVLLSIIPPYSDSFIPKPIHVNFPQVLTELRIEECCRMNFGDLLKKCETIKLTVTDDHVSIVERETRSQSKSKLWYRFRAGRITASIAKAACHTDANNPSQSLIKTICYPESTKFSNDATRWGCEHEKFAIEHFVEKVSAHHDNMNFEDSGLLLNPEFPHLGASPDGIISCDCCGKFCVEVKCPFCKKDQELNSSCDKDFCLEKNEDGTLCLKKNHPYYYQVQTQLGISKLDSCFFVVWTEKDIHIELISLDDDIWKSICEKTNRLFATAILPELVGKFYTRVSTIDYSETCGQIDSDNKSPVKTSDQAVLQPSSSNSNINTSINSTPEETWCYCDQVESGSMICCDNENCAINWFHYQCVGVENAPKDKWYCPDCRKLPQFKRKSKVVSRKKKPLFHMVL